MKGATILCIIVFCFFISGPAQAVKKPKKAGTYAKLIEAWSYCDLLPEKLPNSHQVKYTPGPLHFMVIWKSKEVPEHFFWCKDSICWACSYGKVHKNPHNYTQRQEIVHSPHEEPRQYPRGVRGADGYYYEFELGKEKHISIGDTLVIYSSLLAVDNKAPFIPDRKNTLFYETKGTDKKDHWLRLHIDTVLRKPEPVVIIRSSQD